MPTRPTVGDMHIQGPLSNISVAYRNDAYIADMVFPNVPVQKQSDKFYTFDKASWFRNEAGTRAPRTRAPEGGYSLSQDSYTCIPISFAALVADEEEMNADNPLTPRRTAVEFATDKVLLAKEKKVADLVFGTGWASSATPSPTFDDPASDPIEKIEIAKETVVKAIGREPNVAVMGREVWTDLRRHPDLLDVLGQSQRGLLTTAQLSDIFEIPKILIGRAIYEDTTIEDEQYPSSGTLTDTATGYSFLWGKHIWLGYVTSAPALATPTAGYVFVWRARSVKTFRREEEETTVYRAEENFDEKVTASDAGYLLKSCVA